MNKTIFSFAMLFIILEVAADARQKPGSPEDNLPANIKRVTQFGERPDFSLDGKKILFVEKTYGDVYEVELATG